MSTNLTPYGKALGYTDWVSPEVEKWLAQASQQKQINDNIDKDIYGIKVAAANRGWSTGGDQDTTVYGVEPTKEEQDKINYLLSQKKEITPPSGDKFNFVDYDNIARFYGQDSPLYEKYSQLSEQDYGKGLTAGYYQSRPDSTGDKIANVVAPVLMGAFGTAIGGPILGGALGGFSSSAMQNAPIKDAGINALKGGALGAVSMGVGQVINPTIANSMQGAPTAAIRGVQGAASNALTNTGAQLVSTGRVDPTQVAISGASGGIGSAVGSATGAPILGSLANTGVKYALTSPQNTTQSNQLTTSNAQPLVKNSLSASNYQQTPWNQHAQLIQPMAYGRGVPYGY